MIEIRGFEPRDVPELKRIHAARGFAFEFPENLNHPLWHVKIISEDEGRIVAAAFARLTSEVYGFIDPTYKSPEERFTALVAMHQIGCEIAYKEGGLSDLHCWLPPEIERPFGRRLKQLGWKKQLWPCYCRELGPRKEN